MWLKNQFTHRPLTFQERQQIREFYAIRMEAIMRSIHGWGFDKYKFPFLDEMSPLERAVFDECVSAGFPMYPEFPVGRFHVDLGNPISRIAIECDGAEFHRDLAKDAARDADLTSRGWTVYRITAKTIFRTDNPPSESCINPNEDGAVCWNCSHCDAMKRFLRNGSLEAFVMRIRESHMDALGTSDIDPELPY